jgi:hypothetical protein
MGEGGVPKMEVTESTGVEAANFPLKIIQNNRT